MVQVKRLNILILLIAMLYGIDCAAQVTFNFDANSSISGAIKTTMERNISALLTEINRAGNAGTALNLAQINMEPEAKKRLVALWDDAHFVCDKPRNISKCLNDFQGYQVRALPITMKPAGNSYKGSLNRELTISLNKRGVITGVRPAWEIHEDVSKIMTSPTNEAADTRMRREILKWVEDFRCYYNEKNLNALNQIYSDDALIITGSVVQQRHNGDNGVRFNKKVIYTAQTKHQYINKLSGIFRNNQRINVEFDHISVVRHGAKPNIYGVTLHQTWQTSRYCDEGWLFLLWDFNDPERPQIHVRTWQPEQAVVADGIFSLDDFFIP